MCYQSIDSLVLSLKKTNKQTKPLIQLTLCIQRLAAIKYEDVVKVKNNVIFFSVKNCKMDTWLYSKFNKNAVELLSHKFWNFSFIFNIGMFVWLISLTKLL